MDNLFKYTSNKIKQKVFPENRLHSILIINNNYKSYFLLEE